MATPTVEDVLRLYDNRPAPVRQVLEAAATATLLRDVPKTTFLILLALLARSDRHDPEEEFAAIGQRCAEEVEANRKTFTRAITRFEEAGWIQRAGGGRRPSGRFGALRFKLAGALLDLVKSVLGRGTQGDAPIPSPHPQKQRNGASMSHGYLTTCNLSEDHGARPREIRGNPTPPDLKPLEEFGLGTGAIWKLVGIASKAGHRLSDIAQVAIPHLKRLSLCGSRAYCYLLKMTSMATDYKSKAAARHADAISSQQKEEKNNRLENGRKEVGGKRFAGRGEVFYAVEGNGAVAGKWHAGRLLGYVVIDIGFLDALADGRLWLCDPHFQGQVQP